ncbi:MAG: hypothetical protein ACI9UV_002705, partial [Algoriphagus sp.]
ELQLYRSLTDLEDLRIRDKIKAVAKEEVTLVGMISNTTKAGQVISLFYF